LLEELDAVADELVPTVEAAGIHRTEPALHVAHHLQQEDVSKDQRGERHDRENDDGLDRRRSGPAPPDVDREHVRHLSMSPKMKYKPARIVITSGTYTPRSTHGRIDTLLNDALRIFTRNGPVAPFDAM